MELFFELRTQNNKSEGWHNKIKIKVRHAHPNLFEITSLLKKSQAFTEVTIIQLAAGGVKKPKELKYRDIENRLNQLKERYRQGIISVFGFADAASHPLHLD